MKEAVERLYRRLLNIVGRSAITFSDDTDSLQRLQVQTVTYGGEAVNDDVPRVGEYGLASHAPLGADALLLFGAGDRANGVVIGVEHRQYRLKGLARGEAALYDDLGQVVHLTRAGIVIRGAGLPITITDTPQVTMECALHVTEGITTDADITAAGDIADQGGAKTMAGMRGAFNGHTGHNFPGSGPDHTM